MPAVVSDASPFIYLTHLGYFDFLRQVYTSVLVPPAVWGEVGERGSARPEGQALKAGVTEGWIEVAKPVGGLQDSELLALGSGEREAIQLTHERSALLIIDEARGRKVASRLGFN